MATATVRLRESWYARDLILLFVRRDFAATCKQTIPERHRPLILANVLAPVVEAFRATFLKPERSVSSIVNTIDNM